MAIFVSVWKILRAIVWVLDPVANNEWGILAVSYKLAEFFWEFPNEIEKFWFEVQDERRCFTEMD